MSQSFALRQRPVPLTNAAAPILKARPIPERRKPHALTVFGLRANIHQWLQKPRILDYRENVDADIAEQTRI